jgi:hypothetical protein
LLVLAGVGVFVVLGFFRGGMTVEQAEAIAAGVPYGASREQVESWLDQHHLEHVYDEGPIHYLHGEFARRRLPEKGDVAIAGVVWANISAAHLGWWKLGDIRLYFFMDEHGSLIKRWVKAAPYLN